MHESQDGGKSGDADLVAGDQARPEKASAPCWAFVLYSASNAPTGRWPHIPPISTPLILAPFKLRLPSRVPLNIM